MTAPECTREAICEHLKATPYLEHRDPRFKHGRGFASQAHLHQPKAIWKSERKPREDHGAPKWLTATEFQDHPDVLAAKCKQLAQLIQLSRKTVLYTGAGISASVVGQAALSGTNTVGWKAGGKRAAKPTYTHYALGLLGREGLCSGWVQQNHDGLPQKAGFPQEAINEVHGSWYDPHNPVVKYSGSLHDEKFPWMQKDAETADLVIVLGWVVRELRERVRTNKGARKKKKRERIREKQERERMREIAANAFLSVMRMHMLHTHTLSLPPSRSLPLSGRVWAVSTRTRSQQPQPRDPCRATL